MLGQPGIGSISYEGEAADNAKVAAFLEAMTKNTGLLDPFATQAAKEQGGAVQRSVPRASRSPRRPPSATRPSATATT